MIKVLIHLDQRQEGLDNLELDQTEALPCSQTLLGGLR